MKAPNSFKNFKSVHNPNNTKDLSSTRVLAQAQDQDPLINSTSSLLKWISNISDKRRVIRKKTRCSNLWAETLLTNSLRNLKSSLTKKQEAKRRRLQEFINQQHNSNSNGSCQEEEENFDFELVKDSNLKKSQGGQQGNQSDQQLINSTLQSLDSFFNELSSGKP